MYGCDVMVTEDLEPRLLEVTFSPAHLAASPAWPVRSEPFTSGTEQIRSHLFIHLFFRKYP